MIRGYYTAASGLWTQEKKLNTVANNIANVSTVGYKGDNLVMGTFGEHLTIRMNAYQQTTHHPVNNGVYMQIVDEKYIDYEQGGFESTTRPMDMAIKGDGFFVVNTNAGEQLLTRDGQFSLDEEGYLVLPGFGRVQGQGGDILIGTADFVVDQFGGIFTYDEEGVRQDIDRLQLAIPNDYDNLDKVYNSMYTTDDFFLFDPDGAPEDYEGDLPVIMHYTLERSNVNMSDEMTRMIASQRQLQSCSQIVKMYDEMAEEIATRVSRMQ